MHHDALQKLFKNHLTRPSNSPDLDPIARLWDVPDKQIRSMLLFAVDVSAVSQTRSQICSWLEEAVLVCLGSLLCKCRLRFSARRKGTA
ncbi:hypothetical protein AMELA_G00043820 [Ameiurus melas]|uniref:Uncharacterized protein n=1 Tax=Ameiurus melas TaxID=219545 RepID=A0A7J6B472_AMEME|nr:hypothetical protein AMELA_G00043820 [Ameiurus melas]